MKIVRMNNERQQANEWKHEKVLGKVCESLKARLAFSERQGEAPRSSSH
jgi:hypothetical protein